MTSQSPRPKARRCQQLLAACQRCARSGSITLDRVPLKQACRMFSDDFVSRNVLKSSQVACCWHRPGRSRMPLRPLDSPTNMVRVSTGDAAVLVKLIRWSWISNRANLLPVFVPYRRKQAPGDFIVEQAVHRAELCCGHPGHHPACGTGL